MSYRQQFIETDNSVELLRLQRLKEAATIKAPVVTKNNILQGFSWTIDKDSWKFSWKNIAPNQFQNGEEEDSDDSLNNGNAGDELAGNSSTVIVKSLANSCDVQELTQLFSPYGTITRVDIPSLKHKAATPGLAFVEYLEASAAFLAVNKLHNIEFLGKNLRLEATVSQTKRAAPQVHNTNTTTTPADLEKEKVAKRKLQEIQKKEDEQKKKRKLEEDEKKRLELEAEEKKKEEHRLLLEKIEAERLAKEKEEIKKQFEIFEKARLEKERIEKEKREEANRKIRERTQKLEAERLQREKEKKEKEEKERKEKEEQEEKERKEKEEKERKEKQILDEKLEKERIERIKIIEAEENIHINWQGKLHKGGSFVCEVFGEWEDQQDSDTQLPDVLDVTKRTGTEILIKFLKAKQNYKVLHLFPVDSTQKLKDPNSPYNCEKGEQDLIKFIEYLKSRGKSAIVTSSLNQKPIYIIPDTEPAWLLTKWDKTDENSVENNTENNAETVKRLKNGIIAIYLKDET